MAENTQEEKTVEPQSANSVNLLADLYAGTDEQTFFRSSQVPSSYDSPYNSDDLWQKKGDYTIYEDMLNDDQVSICLQLKKDLIIGSGFSIQPASDDQEEMAKEIESIICEKTDIPFEENIEEILTACEFGFSLSEKIFKNLEEGKLGLKYLKTRHPNSWLIHQDDKGNVSKYEQITDKGNIAVDPKSLIHYAVNKKFQNPYGKSDLRACYNAWFAKKQIVKFFAIFMEKGASPTPVGRYDKNAPQSAVTKLLTILKNFQTKTAITIPKEIEVEFLEAKNNGDVYTKAIHLFNMFIGRSLFIPDLLGFSGAEIGGGSYALGKEQMALFFKHIDRRRRALENIINKNIIEPIVYYNYGFVENYPKFKFLPTDEKEAIELAKTWLEAVKGKLYKASDAEINHFRKLMKFPEGEVERENLMQQGIPGQQIGEINSIPDEDGNCPSGTRYDPRSGKCIRSGKAQKKEEVPEVESEKKSFGKIFDLPAGDYHKKCDFKAIKTKLDDYDQSIMNDSQKIVQKILADLFDQIEKKKIIQTQNTQRIDTLTLKYKKELKQVLKASFMQLYKDAQSQASTEIFKAKYARPLSSDKFLEVIEDETFKYIGDYEYGILKSTRQELIAAIKDGKPLSNVIDVLDNKLRQLSDVSLERFARTKHTEVMNNARKAFFDESGVVAGYQYSAVLDDQTSEICRGLHGKKFKANEAPTPPMHFNCRSVLVPITKFEEFEPSTTVGKVPINEFIEENKGDGFAKLTLEDSPKRPEITDPDVEFATAFVDEVTEVIMYSKNGKPFNETTVVYADKEKKSVRSLTHKRLDNETGV